MNLLYNLRIGRRLTVAFGVMVSMMIVGTLLALWGVHEVNRTGDAALAESREETTAKEMVFNLAEFHKHAALMLSHPDPKKKEGEKAEMAEHSTEYHKILVDLQKTTDPKNQAILREVESAIKAFEGIIDQVVDQSFAKKDSEASILNEEQGIPAFENIEAKVGDLIRSIDRQLVVADQHAELWVSRLTYALTGGLALGLALAVAFGWVITRSITNPLQHAATVLDRVAKGDVSSDVAQELQSRKDEIGDLSRSVQSMVEGLREVVKDLVAGVQTMATSSTQLNTVSADMATGIRETAAKVNVAAAATEQVSNNASSVAASVEQATANLTTVAAATEEMTATITEIAGNAEKARSVTHQAAEQADRASASVSNLGDAAQVIGQVTETINAISSQTNLLALNATIEAARAGAAGKGFAVVANEIKELARQTAAATEDIKSKVSAIQSSTGTAVTDINQIAGVVRQVSEIVNTIAAAIEEQSAVTKDIASNIGQASLGVKDANRRVAETTTATQSITREIADVNRRTSEMATGSEQTLANAAELAQLADQLRGIVARFKVDAASASASTRSGSASSSPTTAEVSHKNGQASAPKAKPEAARPVKTANFVEWSNEYSVGVPAMDEHHKRLFELINRLHAAMKSGKGTDIIGGVLDDLAKYTEYHFTAEEKLMASHQCSGLKDQQETHAKFIANVAELQRQFASGGKALSFETMNMLKDWLVSHIMRKDSPCMAECTTRHAKNRNAGPAKLQAPQRKNTPATTPA